MHAVVQIPMTDEERAVLEDEVLSDPEFMDSLRCDFITDLNTLKALCSHGPV